MAFSAAETWEMHIHTLGRTHSRSGWNSAANVGVCRMEKQCSNQLSFEKIVCQFIVRVPKRFRLSQNREAEALQSPDFSEAIVLIYLFWFSPTFSLARNQKRRNRYFIALYCCRSDKRTQCHMRRMQKCESIPITLAIICFPTEKEVGKFGKLHRYGFARRSAGPDALRNPCALCGLCGPSRVPQSGRRSTVFLVLSSMRSMRLICFAN